MVEQNHPLVDKLSQEVVHYLEAVKKSKHLAVCQIIQSRRQIRNNDDLETIEKQNGILTFVPRRANSLANGITPRITSAPLLSTKMAAHL